MKEPIAIVGTACRFPGSASSPAKLWELLRNPTDVLSEFDDDKLNLSSFYHPNGEHHGSTNVANKSYLLDDNHQKFDASFFNINPAEADGMDPQQRILLETTYEAFERAGYTLEQMQGSSTAVFVGVMTSDFHDIQTRDLDTIGRWHATGTAPSILANRISYCFNLKGPSMSINTACSSSLVALHQAVQCLRNGESNIAIVGGVNLILDPDTYIGESKLHMLSPTSRCQMWDQNADGYARGEGCAAVVLKTLGQALADGDEIEAIVRETLVNSDGRSPGITMPDAEAQAALIKQTYANSGLDPVNDRCQYFECHGTGTLAGDPVEAEAIQKAFFPDKASPARNQEDKLFVGSIKTVVGHLEGCAGLAGLLKTVACIRNQTVTANLHFNKLNPNIEPFYDHLLIPTKNFRWPPVAPGSPLRASVNSFGFGGTNAHAIVESYSAPSLSSRRTLCEEKTAREYATSGPFVFSAQSKSSLLGNIKSVASYIKLNPSVNLNDLAWVLSTKKSSFSLKQSFTADSHGELLEAIDKAVTERECSSYSEAGTFSRRNQSEPCRILGVFTGQGAQWAAMGRSLILSSPTFHDSINRCERGLADLSDGPSWSLKEELMADVASSRLSEAELSQPLTTAIEIAVCDLLSAAGIHLDVVVGHSSGEIAAAYAAGVISAKDAIKIAYYRGLHVKVPRASGGDQVGGMMAVGITFKDAVAFCNQSSFFGRLVVAASNGPASITLSGDYDAINEAKQHFDQKKIFARILKVEVAYHSHHMNPYADAYLESLRACNIHVQPPKINCTWISSVQDNAGFLTGDLSALTGQYWVDNMLKPVRFSQAVEQCLLNEGKFSLCIEVGPHPALKSPVLQTLDVVLAQKVPYLSLLQRGVDDMKAASLAVGFMWQHFGPQCVNLDRYYRACNHKAPRMVKDLPTYSWDHSRSHWRESRISRRYRLRDPRPHPLLGRRAPDDSESNMRWRNILHLNEIPWLHGNKHIGRVVFPAAGYVSLALETAAALAAERPLALVEIQDLRIVKSITLEDGSIGTECITTLSTPHPGVESHSQARLVANFTCEICPADSTTLERMCTARVILHFGVSNVDELPARKSKRQNLTLVDPANFYELLQSVGLEYTGLFRGIDSMSRKLNHAKASASWTEGTLSSDYLFHPVALEVAFQSTMGAFSSPFSNTTRTPFIPMEISRLFINPSHSRYPVGEVVKFDIDTSVTESNATLIEGNVSLFHPDGHTMVQVEGLAFRSVEEPSPLDDRNIFSHTVWGIDPSLGSIQINQTSPDTDEEEAVETMERSALFYFQRMLCEIDPSEVPDLLNHHQLFYSEVKRVVDAVKDNRHPVLKPQWLDDSEQYITGMSERMIAGKAECDLINHLGPLLPAILRREIDAMEVLNKYPLENLCLDEVIFAPMHKSICDVIKRIVHKHPRMNILEVGAGTGIVTNKILKVAGDAYSSYCLTDASSELAEKAAKTISETAHRISFQVMEIETDVVDQGFEAEAYDLVIVANVLHAAHASTKGLQHIRSLLKPGGYLIFIDRADQMATPLSVMGLIPEWWEGHEQRRPVSAVEWDKVLRLNGFAGVNGISQDVGRSDKHCFNLIVSQAVDDCMMMLREPSILMSPVPVTGQVVIIGGATLPVSRLVHSLKNSLRSPGTAIKIIDDIESLDTSRLSEDTSVISATELDNPFFSGANTQHRLQALQALFRKSKCVLWLTAGRLSELSQANMTMSVGRSIKSRTPDVNLQFLDVAEVSASLHSTVVEVFLRLSWSRLPWLTEKDRLWVNELEIHFDGENIRIPRLVKDHERNERYNAGRRQVFQKIDVNQHPVEIKVGPAGRLCLQSSQTPKGAGGSIPVKTRLSIPLFKEISKAFFLWLGTTQDKRTAIGFSNNATSAIEANPSETCIFNTDHLTPELFQATASYILASLIATSTHDEGSILIYSASDILITAIKTSHAGQRRRTYFVTSGLKKSAPGTISIHPRASRQDVEDVLPKDVSCFFDLSTSCDDSLRTILVKLYENARQNIFDLFRQSANRRKMIMDSLSDAKTNLHTLPRGSTNILGLEQLDGSPDSTYSYTTMIDWTHSSPLAVQIQPLDPSALFSSSKTYCMVDMTMSPVSSLLSWMARNGARNFALIGRNTQISQASLEEISALGADVKVMKADFSSRDSVLEVCKTVTRTMPPVAGVCYALMGLSPNPSEDKVDDSSNPSAAAVQGVAYLDEFFSQPTLDFFVVVSTLGTVMGTSRWLNLPADSLSIPGLVEQRRKKGLAASVIYMGMVVDLGYMARQSKHNIQRMAKLGYAPLSEPDIHHSFAEAIVSSSCDSAGSPEIVLGLQQFKKSASDPNIPWCSDPFLSHFVTKDTAPDEQQQQSISPNSSVIEQLDNSKSKDHAFHILEQRLSAKVQSMLHLSPNTLDTHKPLIDLGFDSLLAVEIADWFFQELSFHIPASNILEFTTFELCDSAVTHLLDSAAQDSVGQQPVGSTESSNSQTSGSKLGPSSSAETTQSELGDSETSTSVSNTLQVTYAKSSSSPISQKYQRVEEMSPYQSLIWLGGSYMKDPSQYNVVISYEVKGNFQLARFERALSQTVSWHEMLRTAFFADPVRGQLLQAVMNEPLPFFRHIETLDTATVSREFENAASLNWRLEEGETFQVTVVSVGSEQHTVIFAYHHIIMDGVSWSVFLRDLKSFYELGTPPTSAVQYIDYSVIQNRAIRDGTFTQELDYWKRELSPLPAVMPLLPFAKIKQRVPIDDYTAHTMRREIGKITVDKIKKTSVGLRGTSFHFFLATLNVLLARLLNVENICIGIGDANRKQRQFANTIGYFVNVVPVQVAVAQEDTFANVYQKTSKKALLALSNSSVPSSVIVDTLKIQRASSHTPIFQVAMNYRVGEITKMSVADFELNYEQSAMGNPPYDISFHITPTESGTCILEVTCRDYIYTREAAESILDTYADLIDSFSCNTLLPARIPIPPSPTIDGRKLSIRRGPRLDNGWPTTLSKRFENMLKAFGSKVAIVQESGEFTYAQLGAHTNRIANVLLEEGIARGDVVGILCQPSLAAVASMLAVLVVGAVHLPLDLSIPTARHTVMIKDSGASIILCSSSTCERALALGAASVLNVEEVGGDPNTPVQDRSSGAAPSVLLYTSGSTGKPKGVLLPQIGFINYLAAKEKELALDSRVVVLQQSSIGFDMGLAQTLNAVMNGGKLVIVPQTARGDPIEIAKFIRKHKVTFTLATPSEYLAILQHAREHMKGYTLWKYACLGGEPFTDRLKLEFAQLGTNCPIVQDSYGLTEISACTTFETMTVSQVETARSVGKAIANTSLYVLDKDHNPVDIGVPGEVCAGGIGIALGYLDKEQTKLKFHDDPFATPDDIARGWTRMYCTGDKGCLLEDGSLIHMGRMDGNTEIKLRGLRIDLEDVASTLVTSASGLLSSAVVCTKGEGDSQILVAYVALVPGQTASEADLQILASSLPLPQYMCPARIVCLESLPRNANGKIDRKAIESRPFESAIPKPLPLPSSRLTLGEGELKLLWQGILPNNPQIQPDTDFFMVGGNSLLLVKLQSAIRTSIGVSITIRELYGASTLSSMAIKITTEKAKSPSKSVNWFEETLIPEELLNSAKTAPVSRRSASTGCEILLTGSTGFLGSVLVQALVENSLVSKVHCIAVEKGHEDSITGSDKVIVHYGSLLDSALGLSTADHTMLLSCIDVVIHAGSNGHCLNFYNSLRTPNLLSTHFLARFCHQAQIPLHYISSPRVILLTGNAALGPVSVSSHPPPADGSEGLTATKWASEAFLERYAQHTGLPVCIHRPCTPIGDNAPHQDALNSMLRYSNIMGATPQMTNMDGYLDFQKVEIIADEIATQVMDGIDNRLSSVVFRHHSSHDKVSVKSFREYMERVHSRPFGELSLRDWSTRALELGIEPLIPSFLEAVAENTETMFFPYLGSQHGE
ncbi:Acyl transferase/acyl hydrolase/lysophospholipase [Penicillium griseofulvum]|uniref:Acyl transferase/acyl hydrolase/lysophospholipase n=1 Tax=Penicillium patulum TaxID=5078 RepID=A0A135LJY8_PENPA|nr:Acyl transferase/acyl hydrolase/lysophospholipase [Penicillium griseofulvum]KXG49293.1 Acyl transferase/acyl hydrolase/lysophospholipase [Penicillium griseofulvum]